MNTYQTLRSGAFLFNGMKIPNDVNNRHYKRMQQEVAAGGGAILAYATSNEELTETALEGAADARRVKEGAGVLWSKGRKTYVFDSSVSSQNRFTAAQAVVTRGRRANTAVWKCAEVVGQSLVLTFLPMTSNDFSTVADLVSDHVQKCFEAEAVTANKIMAGDLAADYETEFAAL